MLTDALKGKVCLSKKIKKIERLALEKNSKEEVSFSDYVEKFLKNKNLFEVYKRVLYSPFDELTEKEKLFNLLLHSISVQSYIHGDGGRPIIFLAIKDCVEGLNLFDECFALACKYAGIKNET